MPPPEMFEEMMPPPETFQEVTPPTETFDEGAPPPESFDEGAPPPQQFDEGAESSGPPPGFFGPPPEFFGELRPQPNTEQIIGPYKIKWGANKEEKIVYPTTTFMTWYIENRRFSWMRQGAYGGLIGQGFNAWVHQDDNLNYTGTPHDPKKKNAWWELVNTILDARSTPESSISSSGVTYNGQQFDYVIAGGSLTGLTVASRLTEDPSISVLVIEHDQNTHNDPGVYDSAPLESHNGSRLAMDPLSALTGDDSWGWDTLNEIMIKAGFLDSPDTEMANVSSPAGISGSIQQSALNASGRVWAGLQCIANIATGVFIGALVIPNMLQSDASHNQALSITANISEELQTRSNFHMLTDHRVVEIEWADGLESVASGVWYQACQDCDLYRVGVNSDVVLAAGSLQSPQILELSGVGDPEVLKGAGIPSRVAISGVGKNMQEQTKNSLSFTPKDTDFNGTGPSTAVVLPNINQVLRDNATATYDWVLASLPSYTAELEAKGLIAANSSSAAAAILEAQAHNLFQNTSAAAEIFFTVDPALGQVDVDLLNPMTLSRGTTHIQSNNSWAAPLIDTSSFGHPLDIMVQSAAAKQAREVLHTEPLASLIAHEDVLGAAVAQDASPAEWMAWINATSTPVGRYTGTLSMMQKELGGVVDSRFRVYGTANVRVVGESILPIQISADMWSSLSAIAEKAATTIKEDRAVNHWFRDMGILG